MGGWQGLWGGHRGAQSGRGVWGTGRGTQGWQGPWGVGREAWCWQEPGGTCGTYLRQVTSPHCPPSTARVGPGPPERERQGVLGAAVTPEGQEPALQSRVGSALPPARRGPAGSCRTGSAGCPLGPLPGPRRGPSARGAPRPPRLAQRGHTAGTPRLLPLPQESLAWDGAALPCLPFLWRGCWERGGSRTKTPKPRVGCGSAACVGHNCPSIRVPALLRGCWGHSSSVPAKENPKLRLGCGFSCPRETIAPLAPSHLVWGSWGHGSCLSTQKSAWSRASSSCVPPFRREDSASPPAKKNNKTKKQTETKQPWVLFWWGVTSATPLGQCCTPRVCPPFHSGAVGDTAAFPEKKKKTNQQTQPNKKRVGQCRVPPPCPPCRGGRWGHRSCIPPPNKITGGVCPATRVGPGGGRDPPGKARLQHPGRPRHILPPEGAAAPGQPPRR